MSTLLHGLKIINTSLGSKHNTYIRTILPIRTFNSTKLTTKQKNHVWCSRDLPGKRIGSMEYSFKFLKLITPRKWRKRKDIRFRFLETGRNVLVFVNNMLMSTAYYLVKRRSVFNFTTVFSGFQSHPHCKLFTNLGKENFDSLVSLTRIENSALLPLNNCDKSFRNSSNIFLSIADNSENLLKRVLLCCRYENGANRDVCLSLTRRYSTIEKEDKVIYKDTTESMENVTSRQISTADIKNSIQNSQINLFAATDKNFEEENVTKTFLSSFTKENKKKIENKKHNKASGESKSWMSLAGSVSFSKDMIYELKEIIGTARIKSQLKEFQKRETQDKKLTNEAAKLKSSSSNLSTVKKAKDPKITRNQSVKISNKATKKSDSNSKVTNIDMALETLTVKQKSASFTNVKNEHPIGDNNKSQKPSLRKPVEKIVTIHPNSTDAIKWKVRSITNYETEEGDPSDIGIRKLKSSKGMFNKKHLVFPKSSSDSSLSNKDFMMYFKERRHGQQ